MPVQKRIEEVVRVEISVVGSRNFPIVTAKLPINLVSDLPTLVHYAQMIQPEVSSEEVIRAIWRAGCEVVGLRFKSGAHLRTPAPKVVPLPPERYRVPHT
jgi:hypothetical protein